MHSRPGPWPTLSMGFALPRTYTRALVAAQTQGRPLRLHVGARMLSVQGDGARTAVVGWYHSSEAQSWRLEQLSGEHPELVAVLRGTWEAIHHASQRGVRVEIILDPRHHRQITAHLQRLQHAAATDTLDRCHLGVDRACSQLLRRVHGVLGDDVVLRAGRGELRWPGLRWPGLRGMGLRWTERGLTQQLRGAQRAAEGGVRSRAALRTDVRHASWLREWARRSGYVPCHTDGSAAGNQRSGGWAWWVDEEQWDAGRCSGVVSSNSSELEAVARALRDCAPGQRLLVLTDSVYVLRVIAGAGEGALSERVRELARERGARFALVKGHQDPAGHDRADALAWAAYHRPSAVRPRYRGAAELLAAAS